MSGYFTDFLNNRVLDQVFGGVPFAPPATLYVGLSLAQANKAGVVSEPQGAGYARVPVPNDLANFPPASVGSKANAGLITFPAPTGPWGVVRSLFVADAARGGDVLSIADLVTPRAVDATGPAPALAPGALFLSHT